jgi:hypothetical protein
MKVFKFKLSTRIGSTAHMWLVAKAAASQARRDMEAITRALIADAPRNVRDRIAQLEAELKAAEATAKVYEPDLRDLPSRLPCRAGRRLSRARLSQRSGDLASQGQLGSRAGGLGGAGPLAP